jgi:hypothetical protein
MELPVIQFHLASRYLIPLRSKYSPQHPDLKAPQSVLPLTRESRFLQRLASSLIHIHMISSTLLCSAAQDSFCNSGGDVAGRKTI